MGALPIIVLLLGVVRGVNFPVQVTNPMESFSYRTLNGMAMYTPEKAPRSGPPGNGRSYIEFKDFQVDRTENQGRLEAASIQIIVLPDQDINSIGLESFGQNLFCCTPSIMKQGEHKECQDDSQVNKLISTLSSYDNSDGGNYKLVTFAEGEKHATMPEWKYTVKESQIHIIAIAVCDANVGQVTISGTTEWMNPYGHLPGQLFGFLPFYGWMCVVYIVASVMWLLLNALYWKELLHVQNCITGVLTMCLIEMLIWYYDYLYLNNNGVRRSEVFAFGMIISVSRRTIARMLVVAVSMGYGVVKPILGDEKKKILILGAVYWVFAFVFEVFIHYSQTQELPPILRTILTPPVAILDGYFWWWIFASLNETVANLKQKRQIAKLILFTKFSWCLGFSLVIAFVFAFFQLYYVWMKMYLERWDLMWLLEVGFWQALFTVVLFCIMMLWKPSRHASKYAYSQQIATEEMDDPELFEETLGKPDTAEAADDDMFEIGDENEDFSKPA